MSSTPLYHFHSKFILRTPLVPLQKRQLEPSEIFVYTQQPFFMEAIYLASPILHDEITKWHKGELSDQKEIDKLIVSVHKYLTRMQSRCTPYGLFAGCSTGQWTDKNEVVLEPGVKRHTRLDMNYLCALAYKLNKSEVILPLLKFYPNSSLYESGESLRYVEFGYVNGQRVHELSAVDNNLYIQNLLSKAEQGATVSELADSLVSDDITKQEAEDFIKELITAQILVSELEPAITGDEFHEQIIRTLKKINNNIPEINEIIETLESAIRQLENLDAQLGNQPFDYRAICNELRILKTPLAENQLFQADLFKKTTEATLDSAIKYQMLEVLNFLNRFSKRDERTNLKKFRENFLTKYEDAEIPLLQALDTETGIGFTSKDTNGINALIDDIEPGSTNKTVPEIKWTAQQDLLHKKLLEADKTKAYEVEFTDSDLSQIDNSTTALPDSISIIFEMYEKDKVYMHSFGGSSATCLLGRFGHGDSSIRDIINDVAAHEQKLEKERVLAEIIHLPESRIGNILLRPAIREYEIPYLAKSDLPQEQQLPLHDLMVSVRRNRVILRSKKLNKEIVPRLGTAHNFMYNALPVYQFLCELQYQYQDKGGVVFDWGQLVGNYKFLPRARYKNVIFERAKWMFLKADVEVLLDQKNADYEGAVAEWQKKWHVPQFVVLDDGENPLLINFNDPLSVKALVAIIRKKERITFSEYLFNRDNMLVKDQNGESYTNEFIAVLLKNEKAEKKLPAIRLRQDGPSVNPLIQRRFPTGSEWLYYKLYCGFKTADNLLGKVIKPLTEEVIKKGLCDKFFFIRYSDPEHHIRLRFHVSQPERFGQLMMEIGQIINPYLELGMINKIQTDTYNRELERYGENTMELAESLFYIDSMVTLRLLDATEGEAGERLRWQFALRSIDELLDSFNYSPDRKLILLERLKEGFIEEHGAGKRLKLQLDTKFRAMRKHVDNALNRDNDTTRDFNALTELLVWKRNEVADIASKILDINASNSLQVSLDDLLSSYIHMMLNRIFKARQRTYEMVLYDLLYKHYKSTAGREKFLAKNKLIRETA